MPSWTRHVLLSLLTLPLLLAACGRESTPTQPTESQTQANVTQANLSHRGNVTLQVLKAGTGSGTVTSSPFGINCGSTCSKSFSSGTTVTLTATPAAGSVFAGWSGGGTSGTGSATITLNSNTTVTATFNASGGGGETFTLTVNKTGSGSGTVTSTPAGINCGSTCTASFPAGTNITLSATPAAGSVFAGWSGGGTSGTGNATITLTANTTVTAAFNASGETFTLTVNKIQLGAGAGTVTSTPAGINCGSTSSTCTASFPAGTSITLSASPTAGKFMGWSGDACSGSTSPTCTFTLNANMSVSAQFNLVVITDNSLPNGNVGADYSAFINSCCGSGSPDNFSIVSGSLPDGLTMAQNFGVQSTIISGRPTRQETQTFTVKVQDQSGSTTKVLSITIDGAVPLVITLPGPTAKSGTVGTAYSQNLFASGGKTPYFWSSTGGQLPPGLRFVSASNGNRIEGTPTTAGTFTFTLTVTDSGSPRQTATQQTTITIN